MNDHDVMTRLRDALDDVHHERPLPEVARRARVLRARRRAPGAVAAVLAVAGAVTVGVTATAPSSFADWTSEPQVADPAVAAVIDESCRTSTAPEGGADDELLLLDVRGQHAVAVYRDEAGGVWSCNRFQGGGRPTTSAGGTRAARAARPSCPRQRHNGRSCWTVRGRASARTPVR